LKADAQLPREFFLRHAAHFASLAHATSHMCINGMWHEFLSSGSEKVVCGFRKTHKAGAGLITEILTPRGHLD